MLQQTTKELHFHFQAELQEVVGEEEGEDDESASSTSSAAAESSQAVTPQSPPPQVCHTLQPDSSTIPHSTIDTYKKVVAAF